MIDFLETWWRDNALVFLAGAAVIPVAGAGAVAWCRAPILRRRLAETTLLAFWLWLALALVPASARPVAVRAEPGPGGVAAVLPAPARAGGAATPGLDPAVPAGVALGAGALWVLARLAAARLRLQRVLRRSVPAPAAVVVLARELAGTDRPPRIVVSHDVWRPFCCGLLAPRVVLPAALLASGARARLRSVLLHELAHLEQGDLRGHALFALTAPLLFWNPLFWWLRRDARLAAELVADDVAARRLGKADYVRDLIEVADRPSIGVPRGSVALAVVGRESEFFRRMNMLIARTSRLSTRCSKANAAARWAGAVAIAVAGSLAWTAPPLAAQDPQPKPAPASRPTAAPKPEKPEKAPRVYFNFKDTDVAKVVDTIVKIAGANVVMPPTLTGKVTLQLKNVSWKEALAVAVRQVGHEVTENEGVVIIVKPPPPPPAPKPAGR